MISTSAKGDDFKIPAIIEDVYSVHVDNPDIEIPCGDDEDSCDGEQSGFSSGYVPDDAGKY